MPGFLLKVALAANPAFADGEALAGIPPTTWTVSSAKFV